MSCREASSEGSVKSSPAVLIRDDLFLHRDGTLPYLVILLNGLENLAKGRVIILVIRHCTNI